MVTAKEKHKSHTFDMPQACTNIWKIALPEQELIRILLEPTGVVGIDYFSREIPRHRKETAEQYFARMHAEGKSELRRRLALPSGIQVHYEFLRVGNLCYFMYLTDQVHADEKHMDTLLSSGMPTHQIAQAAISLRIKAALLEEVYKDYEIAPHHYNGALYIGTELYPRKKDGRSVIDTFEARFYFTDRQELVSTLHNRTFLAVSESDLHAPVNDTTMTILAGNERYVRHAQVDARLYGRKKFMRFQTAYPGCRNHTHTLVARCVEQQLGILGIPARRQSFKATDVWDQFVCAADPRLRATMTIVDNYGPYPSESCKEKLYEQLRQAFSPCEIVSCERIAGYDDLHESTAYLFLNKEAEPGGTSIVETNSGRQFASFWQALTHHRENGGIQFDLYTRLKIDHFNSRGRIVMQGVDLPCQMPADGAALNAQVLLKVQKELWLKQGVLQDGKISALSGVPSGRCRLIYIRRPENLFFASILMCRVERDTLYVEEQSVCENEDELRFHFSYLNVIEKLYDDGFYLYDCDAKVLLTAYTSARVPQIMGNALFDNVQRFHDGGGTLRKLSSPNENPLPYYVMPRIREQYHHIFLQEAGGDLRYFVSPKGNPQSVFAHQCRTYNILTWNELGQPTRQLEQSVTATYLQSFTDDILLNGQVSKSSIMVKAARLFLEN